MSREPPALEPRPLTAKERLQIGCGSLFAGVVFTYIFWALLSQGLLKDAFRPGADVWAFYSAALCISLPFVLIVPWVLLVHVVRGKRTPMVQGILNRLKSERSFAMYTSIVDMRKEAMGIPKDKTQGFPVVPLPPSEVQENQLH